MGIMTVDIAPRQLGDPVYVSQGDIGRIIKVHMYDGDDPYIPPAGVTPYIQGLKPSGLGFNVQGTITDNVCTFSTTDEMTDEVGDMVAEVRLIKTGMDIGTANFRYSVEERPRPDGTTDGTIEVMTDIIAEALEAALEDIDTARAATVAQLATAGGVIARTASQMTEPDQVYIYVGSESGYSTGYWYYNNGTNWVPGGQYGGAITDTTLSIDGAAANSSTVGAALETKVDIDAVTALDTRVTGVEDNVGNLANLQTENKTNLVEAINEAAQTGSSGGGDTVPMNVRQAIYDLFKTALYDSDMPEYSDLQSNLAAVLSWIEAVTAINLFPRSIMLNSVGATSQLTATTVPAGGTIVWSSSDESVATVSQTGLVTITGFGSCTITATCGFVSASCSVVASSVTLSSISAVYTPSGKVYTTDTLDSLKSKITVTAHWSDSSTSEVSAGDYVLSGTLTKGTSVITVGYGGKSDTVSVTVTGRYTVTNNLTNATTSNNSTGVDDGASYTATLTAGSGYSEVVATVTMGGTDITSTAYNNGVISIASVTGNVVITAHGASAYLYHYPFKTDLASIGQSDLGFSTYTAGTAAKFENDGTYDYLKVTGTDDTIVADTPADLDMSGDFTISFYTKILNNSNSQYMFGWAEFLSTATSGTMYAVQKVGDYTSNAYRQGQNRVGITLKCEGTGFSVSIVNKANTYNVNVYGAPAASAFNNKSWHHTCLQRSNGIITAYVDKQPIWTITTADELYISKKLAIGALWSMTADDGTFWHYSTGMGIRDLIITKSAININTL